jgi:hypothetical protein
MILGYQNTNHRKCVSNNIAGEFCTGQSSSLEGKFQRKKNDDEKKHIHD